MSGDGSIDNAAGFDLQIPTASLLASIPWEGAPIIDPDRSNAGDFFEAL